MSASLIHLFFPVIMADPWPHLYAFASSSCGGSASASTSSRCKPSLLGLRPSWPVLRHSLSFSSITCGLTSGGSESRKEGDDQGELLYLASQTNGSSNKGSSVQSASNRSCSFPTRVRVEDSISETLAMPSGCTRVSSRWGDIPSRQGASGRTLSCSHKPHYAAQESRQGKAVAGKHRRHSVDERYSETFEEEEEHSAVPTDAEKMHRTKVSFNAKSTLQQQQNIQFLNPLSIPAGDSPYVPCFSNSSREHGIPAARECKTPWGRVNAEDTLDEIPVERPRPVRVKPFSSEECKFPWERDAAEDTADEVPLERPVRVKPPSLAELLIPMAELRTLRIAAFQLKEFLKIGKLGVTDATVSSIHERFHYSELVKVRFDGPASNMKKIHEDLESKSGGLVIWRYGNAAVIYKGDNYSGPIFSATTISSLNEEKASYEVENEQEDQEYGKKNTVSSEINTEKLLPVNLSKQQHDDTDILLCNFEYETEMDHFLDDLGPRYKDWTGFGRPVPVDGDLLPSVDQNFKPPFRTLPYGVNPKLSNLEMTNLRRVARLLAPHFAVGKSREYHGLAASIIRLWEKSEVAKIVIKSDVQNIHTEVIAEELKLLTGGVLLSRDKEFITLYRGKDFLPQPLAELLAERETMTGTLLEQEESLRNGDIALEFKTIDTLPASDCGIPEVSVAETESVRNASVALQNRRVDKVMPISASISIDFSEEKLVSTSGQHYNSTVSPLKAFRVLQAHKKERRLAIAVRNKMKAEVELQKLQKNCTLADPPIDQEVISDKEKAEYRKLGLAMKAFLLVGKRGVFDGVIENMHLHWKHRELVKLIYKGKDRCDIEETARMLENESGGILIGIVPVPIPKGQAIIVYRGKNYHRPARLRPKNLLTKRAALKRYTENQRRESLERHIILVEKQIADLKDDLKSKCAGFVSNLDTRCSKATNDGNEEQILPLKRSDAEEAVDEVNYEGLDPIFRADPLTAKQRTILRVQARKLGKPAHFLVGKGNGMAGVIRSIRLFFQHHSLVKVGVKGRARGVSVAEIIQEIEDGTGGVLVSLERCKVVFYRGWPDGEDQPSAALIQDFES